MDAFDRVAESGRPEWWSLEANTGWGKTRILQEFYARLAAERQSGPGYWPGSLVPDRLEARTPEHDLDARRKKVSSDGFTPADGSLPDWFWWGLSCASRAGTPVQALAGDVGQFEAHRMALEAKWRQIAPLSARMKRAVAGKRAEAVDAVVGEGVSLVADVANVAVPGLGLVMLAAKWGAKGLRGDEPTGPVDVTAAGGNLVEELAPELARLGAAGLPLVVVVEDAHDTDGALSDLLARVLASSESRVLVATTSWSGLMEHSHRPIHELLSRVPASAVHRVACEDEVGHLDPRDRAAIVGAVLPGIDERGVSLLTDAFTNPYALQLAGRTGAVRRAAARGSVSAEVVSALPRNVQGLYRCLWDELDPPVRRALMVGALTTPASTGTEIGGSDRRVDPELVDLLEARSSWVDAADHHGGVTELFELARRQSWVRTAEDSWLQFHDPGQFELALDQATSEYAGEAAALLQDVAAVFDERMTAARLPGPDGGPPRPDSRGRYVHDPDRWPAKWAVLVVAAAECEAVPWTAEVVRRAAHLVCRQLLRTGSTGADLAVRLCERGGWSGPVWSPLIAMAHTILGNAVAAATHWKQAVTDSEEEGSPRDQIAVYKGTLADAIVQSLDSTAGLEPREAARRMKVAAADDLEQVRGLCKESVRLRLSATRVHANWDPYEGRIDGLEAALEELDRLEARLEGSPVLTEETRADVAECRGDILRCLGRTEEAVRHFRLAADICSAADLPSARVIWARSWVGLLLVQLGDPEGEPRLEAALAELSVERGPADARVVFLRELWISALSKRGEKEKAVTQLVALKSSLSGTAAQEAKRRTCQQLAYLLGELGRHPEALEIIREVTVAGAALVGPAWEWCRQLEAHCLATLERQGEALEVIREFTARGTESLGPTWHWWRTEEARCLILSGARAEGLSLARSLLTEEPPEDIRLELQALVDESSGSEKEAAATA